MNSGPEKFVLRTTLTSPFGFKARMAIDVLGLTDRVTVAHADVTDDRDSLRQQNPLGKIPCLVRADGTSVFDSGVILEFLQEAAGTDCLLPLSGPQRIPKFTLVRLIDGIIDAGALIIYETRFHAPESQSQGWLDYQRGKISRALAALEVTTLDPHQTDAVAIGLACALEFLDRRKAVDWRAVCPQLVNWYAAFTAHEPAFARTRPPAA